MNVNDLSLSPFKKDFPLLVNQPELTYLDSAATAQRPQCVIDALSSYYENLNANALRGLYGLSMRATDAIEGAREKIAHHLHAASAREIIFTKNASESLNLAATCLSNLVLEEGDEVVVSIMEHHSNILPWQKACKAYGAKLVWLYPNEEGVIEEEEILSKITDKTKIVSIGHISNVLGVKNPVERIAQVAREHGAYVVVDAAQSIPHIAINVEELGCDLLAFSGHKVFGPLGIGVLWGREELLEKMPPFLVGGEMIDTVNQESATWAELPYKFEAGTQDGAAIYATGVAFDYLNKVQAEGAEEREAALAAYLMDELSKLEYIELIGASDPANHFGVVSFNVRGIHPHDVSSILDMSNVAIRVGRHCAEPLLTWMGMSACCRASLAFYNDKNDIDRLVEGLKYVWSVFNDAR